MHDWQPMIDAVRQWMLGLTRHQKRILLTLNDLSLLFLSVWLAFSLRLNELYWPANWAIVPVLVAGPVICVISYYGFGLYKLVTRFLGALGAWRTAIASLAAGVGWALLVLVLRAVVPSEYRQSLLVPRSSIILFVLMGGSLIWLSRQLAAALLTGASHATPEIGAGPSHPVLIYGAGTTGVHLLNSLRSAGSYRPVGFIDERANLWGQRVAGLKVYRPRRIGALVHEHNVGEIMLAIPEATRSRRRTVLKRLEAFKVRVRTLPALEDIASGKVGINDLRAVNADDLLGRDRVRPDATLLARCITGKSVLVTGAGGSIGSELARQILAQRPSHLVLLDNSEPALFEIEQELLAASAALPRDPEARNRIVAVLASVLDKALLHKLLTAHSIETIYHAAAYKHVPMVEHNPVAGITNNTFGTRVLAEAARDAGVERFVLISTDKAVRPTNIMGASKRLAELQLQAMAETEGTRTVFTMVRFGNVLDSSGSVVRLFRKQIEAGGPVTVTHPEIIRYFMSIPEAAELVIQAGAMANGGDVFVLDMGAAVKIDTLARSMIRLVGLKVKDASAPDGDIAIVYTGLRPGEKLFEELLITEDMTTTTAHPRIRRSLEPHLKPAELMREMEAMAAALATDDRDAIHAVLKRTVEGYVPDKRVASESRAPQQMRTLH